ncbi:MAG: hypothetical protein EKK45_24710 [Curvibacter sp.]|nr:MAG: hypothetical protein EKK45_24710 [Curvibacter sp.]
MTAVEDLSLRDRGKDWLLFRILRHQHVMAQWKKAADCFQLAAFVQASGQRRDRKISLQAFLVLTLTWL